MNTVVPMPQCALVLTCPHLLLHGPTVTAPLHVQSTGAGAPMLIPGSYLPQGTRAPITVQRQAFPPLASTPMLFHGISAALAPIQSTAMLSKAQAPLLGQSTHYHGAFVASPAWPMFMPSYLPQPQVEQSSTQSERELLAMQRQARVGG